MMYDKTNVFSNYPNCVFFFYCPDDELFYFRLQKM